MIDLLKEGSTIYNICHDPKVKAIVVISAHHEAKDGKTVMIQAD